MVYYDETAHSDAALNHLKVVKMNSSKDFKCKQTEKKINECVLLLQIELSLPLRMIFQQASLWKPAENSSWSC